MVFLVKNWRKAAVLLLALFTVWTLAYDRYGRRCALILDSREVRSLCGKGYSEKDFWERVRTMGAAGALLYPQSLEDLIESGSILRYTKSEIEKLKATKVAADEAPLIPGSLWIRSPGMVARLRIAADAAGIALILKEYEGQTVVTLPDGVGPASVSGGYDPERTRLIAGEGLIPVFHAGTVPELLMSAGEKSLTLVDGAGFDSTSDGRRTPGVFKKSHGLAFGKGMARGERAAFLRDHVGEARPAFLLSAGESPVGGGAAGFIRESAGRGNTLVIARLDLKKGVEENLTALRETLRALRRKGFTPGLESWTSGPRGVSPIEWIIRFVLGLILTVAVPIFSLRGGVLILREMQSAGRLPQASPYREAILAGGVAVAVALCGGAAAYALMSTVPWRVGATVLRWGGWAAGTTFALSWLALYDPDPKALSGFFRKPVGRPSEIRVAIPVVAATLLLFSPGWLESWGPRAWLESFASGGFWWLGSRWKEWLVGYPCLFVGLAVFFERKNLPSRHDPRGWLLLAMFAPVGLAEWAASARMPFSTLLIQTLISASAGMAIGVFIFIFKDKMEGVPS